jgi:hypothetical protein
MQLNLPLQFKPLYYKGLLLKPRKGYGWHFCSTGFKVRKYVVGDIDSRGFIKLHERNLSNFFWLLTPIELETYFEQVRP